MNIYEKLQFARVDLQEANIRKSGQNRHVGYDYFELADFMPKINNLMLEYKMIGVVSFTADLATLRIINAEKPDEIIEFNSPMATAQLKGCHDVQNLGAVQTYLRRYLYVNAFEIVEQDVLDSVAGSTNDNNKQNKTKIPAPVPKPAAGKNNAPENRDDKPVIYCSECTLAITENAENIKVYSERHWGRILCRECQKKIPKKQSA